MGDKTSIEWADATWVDLMAGTKQLGLFEDAS